MISCTIYKMLKTSDGDIPLDVSFTIPTGSLITLYGPSGAGKTTILRTLAGLANPERGAITVNNECWLDLSNNINLLPNKRKIGFVFQDYALFPNMTVYENLQYALDKQQAATIIDELLKLMDLTNLKDRKSPSLSGGQQQRVALARAIVRKPALLLLDEPLSALDVQMRAKLQDYILTTHKRYNLTTILVSHDISEIYKLSDTVIVLEQGKIVKQGTTSEVFSEQYIIGKFQFIGVILSIEPQGIIAILTIQIGNTIVKVTSTSEEAMELSAGDHVQVSSKAFNPLVRKIDHGF